MEKSKSFAIDSNVLVAFFDDTDTQHTNALMAAKMVEDNIVFLHPHVIQEVSTILTYKFGFLTAKKFLDNVENAENIIIPWVDIKREIEFFNNLGKKISFTDSALIKLAKDKKISLLTFDKQIISILNKR